MGRTWRALGVPCVVPCVVVCVVVCVVPCVVVCVVAIWWQTHEIWSNATRIQNHPAAAWNVTLFDTMPFQDNFTKFSYTLLNKKKTRKNLLKISIHHLSRTLIHDFYGDCWQPVVFLF